MLAALLGRQSAAAPPLPPMPPTSPTPPITPSTLPPPIPPRTIGAAFAAAVSARPWATAVAHGPDEWFTFREAFDLATRLAASLRGRYGVGHGDLVAMSLHNCPEWLVTAIAIVSLGAVIVPIEGWDLAELRTLLASHPIKVAVCDNERVVRYASILQSPHETSLCGVILCRAALTGVIPFVDHWRRVVAVKTPAGSREGGGGASITDGDGICDVMPDLVDLPFPCPSVSPGDVCCAVPVSMGPYRGSAMVELTHEDWLREPLWPEDNNGSSGRSYGNSAVLQDDGSPITMFCPVPLRTLLRGDVVVIPTRRRQKVGGAVRLLPKVGVHTMGSSGGRGASGSNQPGRQHKAKPAKKSTDAVTGIIDWSSSWYQPYQVPELQALVAHLGAPVRCSAGRMALVDAFAVDNYRDDALRVFVADCETSLRQHPSVSAAAVFVDHRHHLISHPPSSSSSSSELGQDAAACDSTTNMNYTPSVWGAVTFQEPGRELSVADAQKLMGLLPKVEGRPDLRVCGLVHWRQGSSNNAQAARSMSRL